MGNNRLRKITIGIYTLKIIPGQFVKNFATFYFLIHFNYILSTLQYCDRVHEEDKINISQFFNKIFL